MRYKRSLIGVTAAVLLVAGCGSDGGGSGETSDSAANGGTGAAAEKLPVPVTGAHPDVREPGEDPPEITPRPDDSAGFTGDVEYNLREGILREAGVDGETSAECPDGATQKAGATSHCTATFEGVEIPYEITVDEDYQEGSFITPYQAKPKKALLVAAVVQTEFWERHGPESKYSKRHACDKMPAVKAVEPNSETGYRCQVYNPTLDEYSFFAVKMGNYGPEFEAYQPAG